MKLTENQSFNYAVEAYFKAVESSGGILEQPSFSASNLVNGVWYLRNTNGYLGRVGTKKLELSLT